VGKGWAWQDSAGQVGSGKGGLGWFGKVWQVWWGRVRQVLVSRGRCGRVCLGEVGQRQARQVRLVGDGGDGLGEPWFGVAGGVRSIGGGLGRARQGVIGRGRQGIFGG
jgi:hypothetical protein